MPRRHPSESPTSTEPRLALAEKILGRPFADRELLRRALTHPSAVEDRNPDAYYERLEFLGDSVLGLIIAEEVYRRYPEMPEGGMTRIKVSIVAGTVLAKVARELGLAEAIILGSSERGTGGRGMDSALENCFEALVAALYLDAGIGVAREWVLSTLGPLISEEAAEAPENPKSRLQELVQAHGDTPVYRILGHEGPPHERTFTAAVEVAGEVVGQGSGRSKKEAEAAAAQAAVDALASSGKRRRKSR